MLDPLTIIALIRAGITTWDAIRSAHEQNKIQLTDDQVNQILDEMIADDKRRAEQAEKEAKGD